MKKVLIATLLTTSLLSAKAFNSFQLGASGGLWLSSQKVKKTDEKSNDRIYMLSLFGGYTYSPSKMLYGLELAFNGLKPEGHSVKILGISLAPRIGYKLYDNVAAYFKTSIGVNRWNMNESNVEHGLRKKTFSATPAFGFERFVNDNLSLKFEAGYRIEQINTKRIDPNNFTQSSFRQDFGHFKVSGLTLNVGAAYNF